MGELESRKIEFPGSQGVSLAARLELPDTESRAYVLFAHCFTCGKDTVAAARISRALAEQGIAVPRFDFTGLGQSGGDFANTHFSSNVEGLVHAADHLRERFAAPSVLIGHSLGGAAVLAAAHRIPEARAVATIGAPADPEHVTRLLGGERAAIERAGAAEVCLAGHTFRLRREFLDDIAAQPQAERIRALGLWRCWCCARRPTRSSEWTTRDGSSTPPGTRSRSWRSRVPTTYSPTG
ncbi:alpha/beta fold hydrolase [Amycolatopsis cihanbeyliensis]|uniref:Putative redox protein n=1 Tax=Amycolatopsis cihanbeyliensis TaxID=1128664 RepID=A0A542DF63_AMYCI|nr:alpha/beta fold hydrolase [Amycolatopsis cihanbeyliensis]TQJ01717.1 putative redox protein [Amycolatopsis cihanbeyliensis]